MSVRQIRAECNTDTALRVPEESTPAGDNPPAFRTTSEANGTDSDRSAVFEMSCDIRDRSCPIFDGLTR